MDRELLRLGLVNHAMALGLDHREAWTLVDRTLASGETGDVKELADRVREAAGELVFPTHP